MAVEVGEGLRIVADHRVQIQSLRIAKVCVGHWRGNRRPVGREPAAQARCVVASAEIVVAGFGVAFLSFELVILRAGVGDDALAAVRIEIGVVAERTCRSCDRSRAAEKILRIVGNAAAADNAVCDALAPEENIFVGDVATRVRLVEDFRARAVLIDFPVRFLHAIAVAVIGVVCASGGFDLAFRIPAIGVNGIPQHVSRSVVAEPCGSELVVRGCRHVPVIHQEVARVRQRRWK